jgi:hypothetical protein
MTVQAVSTGEKHEYEGRSYDDWARSGLRHTQQERCVVGRIALLWGVFVTGPHKPRELVTATKPVREPLSCPA